MRRSWIPTLLLLVPSLAAGAGAGEGIVEILDAGGEDRGYVLRAPRGLALDAEGNLYVVGFMSNNVLRVTPDGAVSQIIDESGDGEGKGLVKPRELAVAADGSVVVAGEKTGHVFRIGADGVIEPIFTDAGRLKRPTHVVAGPDGSLYVLAQSAHTVSRLAPDGKVSTVIDQRGDRRGSRLDRPNGLAVDDAGNVFVAGARSRNVFRVSPDGRIAELFDAFTAPAETPLVFPNDLATDGEGNVYVSGNNSGNVLRIAADGATVQLAGGGPRGSALGGTTAVAVADDGAVFFARMGLYGVFRIDPDGAITRILGPEGAGEGKGLRAARGLLVGPKGELYVSGYGSDNVFRLSPAAARAKRPADAELHPGEVLAPDAEPGPAEPRAADEAAAVAP